MYVREGSTKYSLWKYIGKIKVDPRFGEVRRSPSGNQFEKVAVLGKRHLEINFHLLNGLISNKNDSFLFACYGRS